MRWDIRPQVDFETPRFAVLEMDEEGDITEHDAGTCGMTEFETVALTQEIHDKGHRAYVLTMENYFDYARAI